MCMYVRYAVRVTAYAREYLPDLKNTLWSSQFDDEDGLIII